MSHIDVDWELMEKILKELPSNIFFKDTECRYLFATHYWNHIEHDDTEEWSIRGKTDLEIRKDKDNARLAYEQDKKILETGVGCTYVIEVCLDGVTEYLEIIKSPVWDDNHKIMGIVGLINIVTDRVMLQHQLEKCAQTDIMTELYNRRYLEYWKEHEMKQEVIPVSVISADCDGLKELNDNLGHYVGDQMIIQTARLLKTHLPENAMIFRMGGDEFLMLLPDTDLGQAHRYVKILRENGEKILIEGMPLSVSYGVSVIESLEQDLEDAIRRADKEMYQEKEEKKKRKKMQKM